MNYQKVYDQLVRKNHVFSEGEYFETHHKVPKCMGGSDDVSNLVNLTAREHYVAHLLLVKITEVGGNPQAHGKMLYAFNCMKWGRCKGKRSFKFNSRLYQEVKGGYASLRKQMMKTSHNPTKGKVWIMNRTLKQCKCVDSSYSLDDGWEYGRCCDFDAKEHRQKAKREKLLAKEQRESNRIQLLRDMYRFFVDHNNNFELMAKRFGYNHTRNAFMTRCKNNLSEYVPLPNNRWKNKQ